MHSSAKFDRGWGLKTGPSVPKCSLGRSPHRPREASIVHTVRLAERHPTAQAASCWTKLERRAESVESPNFVRRRPKKKVRFDKVSLRLKEARANTLVKIGRFRRLKFELVTESSQRNLGRRAVIEPSARSRPHPAALGASAAAQHTQHIEV